MSLETGSFISALVSTNPTSSDPKSQGDDHLRFLKAKILETFPNISAAVTPTHTELNFVDGVTSAIQTQLDLKAPSISPSFTTPALGTPASGVMTNVTGTAAGLTAGNVTTNANLNGHITSVGNAAVLGSFTSAQLATALTDETGSGAAVFANSPTLVTPALGTPSSGTVTNLTGTASININGTVGATTPAAGTFTTLTSTGNAAIGDAEASDTHAIKGATTLLANSASAALTVTQTGAGNAFVVEDSASTDSTPFVIDSSGKTGIGIVTGTFGATLSASDTGASSGVSGLNFAADANGFGFRAYKTRNASPYSQTIVANADLLGYFAAYGSDGANFINAILIKAEVDGTPGTNDMPGRLVFSTTGDGASSPTERMRIDSAGRVGINVVPSAGRGLTLGGTGLVTGSVNGFGVLVAPSVASDVTTEYNAFRGTVTTDSSAFTVGTAAAFVAAQGTIGSTTITNQFGFVSNSTLTAATNNYGFYSNIAASANRWNFYASGTARNYMAADLTVNGATAIPAGGTAGAGLMVSTTANFGVFFGSGAPTLSAAKGSLYLRSDGSTTNDRMYVNTNGSTTWTAVITAA